MTDDELSELLAQFKPAFEKFDTVMYHGAVVEGHEIIVTLFVKSARVLHDILHAFYNGSGQWECMFSGLTADMRLLLNVTFDRSEYDDDDLKREIDYKVCLLKTAAGG